MQIDETTYAVRLGSQLTAKFAEIYTTLPPKVTEDYKLLQDALLKGLQKTPDRYRLYFDSAKIHDGKNYQQFSTHLTCLLQFWLDASSVADSVRPKGVQDVPSVPCLLTSRSSSVSG